jgi:hypothetical protein
MDSSGTRYNWQARALMQNWVKEVHAFLLKVSERSAVGVQNTRSLMLERNRGVERVWG